MLARSAVRGVMLELLPMPERGVKFPADELPKENPAEELPIAPSGFPRPPQMGSPLSESSESRAPQSVKENDFDPFAPIVEEGLPCRLRSSGKRGRGNRAEGRALTRTRSSAKKARAGARGGGR